MQSLQDPEKKDQCQIQPKGATHQKMTQTCLRHLPVVLADDKCTGARPAILPDFSDSKWTYETFRRPDEVPGNCEKCDIFPRSGRENHKLAEIHWPDHTWPQGRTKPAGEFGNGKQTQDTSDNAEVPTDQSKEPMLRSKTSN